MSINNKFIVMLGCFDTKGEVFHFLRDCLQAQGERVITINTGVMGNTMLFPIDYDADIVALEGGSGISELRERNDRGYAVQIMGKGACKIVARLVAAGDMKAAIGMGGGGGTYIALSAMQEIPFGIPKLCLSTLAVKDLSRQIKSKDILLMPSIVDVAGLNSISKLLIAQAASAICAMAKVTGAQNEATSGCIAISMFGNTTACVEKCTELLQQKGFEVLAFHANGVGGETMEALIRDDYFDAVLDITTTELADDLCGGICSAGPDRLNAAGRLGIPQVVVPGCLDMVNFAQVDTVPEAYRSRELYSWAPDVTLMRTNTEENRKLGEMLAQKVNKSQGLVAILLPLKGISQIDVPDGVFYRPETNQVLFRSIKEQAQQSVPVLEVDAHINDTIFAEKAVSTLLTLLDRHRKKLQTATSISK